MSEKFENQISETLLFENPVILLGMTTQELTDLVQRLGQPVYRGKQLAHWIYQRGVKNIEEMTDLPKDFRDALSEIALIGRSKEVTRRVSTDGTTKLLLEEKGGGRIETVLLPSADRVSVCVSTQVGCTVGCIFCATGASGFERSLTSAEIVDEVLTAQEVGGRRVTHVVFMGMGEPLLNYPNTLQAIHLLNKEVGIGMRNITVSTVGIISSIRKLAQEKLQITLALSLHTADEKLRKELIPVSRNFKLGDIMEACDYYVDLTNRRITYEVVLIHGVTDTIEQAALVGNLLKGRLCAVNLIPYNSAHPNDPYKRPSEERIAAYRRILETRGIEVTQRMERGVDITAACGQLRRRVELHQNRKAWAKPASKRPKK